ncbi:MAG: DMT family transporter [Bacillota bacterium]|nr:DMT family transporter [Bacillota bacterium]
MASNKRKGVILCLLSALAYSLGPILGKLLYGGGFPWQVVVSCRGMIPAFLILLYALFRAKEVFKIQRRHLPLFLVYGVSIALSSVSNYCALYYIDAAVAIVLLYTLPIFTVLLSRVMLKEPLTPSKIVATVMVFVGVMLIIQVFTISSLSSGVGKILGMSPVIFGFIIGTASGLFGAIFTILARKLNKYYSGWTVNSWGYFIAFPVYAVVGLPHIAAYSWTPASVGIIFIVALVGMTAYSLYIVCTHYIEAGEASLIVTLDPVCSITMSLVILGERLTLYQFIGCLLVLSAILVVERGEVLIKAIRKTTDKFAGG